MKSQVQAVVIGGGLIGCSILYHLTKAGWTDVVLLERNELTSGSTWHAAAGIHGLHDNNNISRLQYYTMSLYAALEDETGQSCGIHQPGSIYLACTDERVHQLKIQAAKAKAFNTEFYEISQQEVVDLHPLLSVENVKCAMFEPLGGHVDPSGVTYAYAAGARKRGGEIKRFTAVLETNQRPDDSWDVVTTNGTIHSQVVINAAGLWAREVAQLAGITLPLMTMEHQYFVTEDIPEIKCLSEELPLVADRDQEYYMRQEGQGLLVGAYEKDGRFWAEQGTPLDFGHELLQGDLDRISDNVIRAIDRVPVLAEAGIKKIINGPMIWSPDSSALVGPVPGVNNYFTCCGIIPGFSQSAGLGLTVAQWVIDGEPEMDMFAWDVARYGAWATQSFTKARALDSYSSRFRIHYPNEEREAGRPLKKRPVYAMQQSMGAVFGSSYGWEHPHWFAKENVKPIDHFSYKRPNWFSIVGEECRALREDVGVIDTSNFAKYEITGQGASQWIDSIIANHVPREDGRTCLTPVLGVRGGVAGDFTVARLTEGRYMMFGSGIAEGYHSRIFKQYLPAKDVSFKSVTDEMAGFNVAGPKSRMLMEELTGLNLDNSNFRFMRNKETLVDGYRVIILRVSFTGDLGYELYVDQNNQRQLYQHLFRLGEKYNLAPVGSRALGSLRIEKGYGSWSREYSPEYFANECGLDHLIKIEKPTFLNKDRYLKIKDNPPRQLLCSLAIDTDDADAWGGEPVFKNDQVVGRVTSGFYGFTVQKSIALAYIDTEHVVAGAEFDVAILGEPHRCDFLSQPLFDPDGHKARS